MRRKRKGSHSVYDVRVHIVWVTKYRYKVLRNKIAERVRDLIKQSCDARDIRILRGHVSADHVHMYISYPPNMSISEIVQVLKGRSSRKIQQEFPDLGKRYWGQHFWAIGYAAFSAGEVTGELIQQYVASHGKSDEGSFTID